MPQDLISLRIGGVPEHFNMPLWLNIESKQAQPHGLDLNWVECPGGTGEMMRKLATGELDIALALSEGSVAAIADGLPAKLLQWYVVSPLHWGIHVAARSPFSAPDQLRGARFACSRFGSGSHLMSYVLALQQGWLSAGSTDTEPTPLQFVEVGNLAGGIEALSENRADVFLWERFTTQPWVDRGIFRRIGICPTPWPAFAYVVRTDLSDKAFDRLQNWVRDINHQAPAFQRSDRAAALIAERCQLAQEAVEQWLQLTRWAQQPAMARSELQSVIDLLSRVNIIPATTRCESLVLNPSRLN